MCVVDNNSTKVTKLPYGEVILNFIEKWAKVKLIDTNSREMSENQ